VLRWRGCDGERKEKITQSSQRGEEGRKKSKSEKVKEYKS
jgi:hypothetical protein